MSKPKLSSMLVLTLISCSLSAAQQTETPAKGNQAPPKATAAGETGKSQTAAQREQTSSTAQEHVTDFARQVEILRAERAQAQGSGAQTKAAEAAINEARTLELWGTVDRAQASHVSEAASVYLVAMASGTPGQRSLAANNLGVLLLRQGDPVKALGVFREVDLKAIDPADLYIYQYNYGRTLELNKDSQGAYTHYREAVKLRPDFMPAVEGALRTLWEVKPAPVTDAAGFADTLVRAGRADAARDLLKRSLALWSSEPNASQLLGGLVRCYGAERIEFSHFFQEDWPLLLKLGASPLGAGIRELGLAFSAKFPYSFGHNAEPFPYWSNGPYREPFGELLRMVGDQYANEERYPQALACYSNAWVISRLPEAALYTAALIRDHRELDTDGRLLNQLVESLFEQKGDAYARQDWPNILRLHTVLGTIFESQSRWGPAGDPRSAIFQWQHALYAESMVRAKDPKFPPSPGLHLHLANSYVKVGQPAAARSEYLAAAEGFLQASDREQAAMAIEKLRSLGDIQAMTPDEIRRLKAVEAGTAS
ncbi:MAG TPA: hypothetical protein VE398_12080 [Acidobacteriota bacterium]|nr:hypothetical protein [Acidobacteriota bacterium]